MATKKKATMGRPKLPDGEHRNETVKFRCSPGEKAEIEQAAEKSGRRLSDWLRDLALRAARRTK